MAIWGVVSACTALVHNFNGLVVARFFLGFMEAYVATFKSCKQPLTDIGLISPEPSFFCQVGTLAESWLRGLQYYIPAAFSRVGLVASLVRVLSTAFTGSVAWSLGGKLCFIPLKPKTNIVGGYLSLREL